MSTYKKKPKHGATMEVREPPAAPVPNREMFSAATFYDVLTSSKSSTKPTLEPDENPPRPAVIAFYGFRGGAGRTLALAHTLSLLSRRLPGTRLAAIDLDLEAPGLHVALGRKAPPEGIGAAYLLREMMLADPDERVDVMRHVEPVDLEGGGKLFVVPAGAVSRRYLATIEELGVGAWHARPEPRPLQRTISALASATGADAIFIDCRTGFSGLSATALFHVADVAVVFLPLSDQVWEGVRVVLESVRAARQQRASRPALLFVPAMVPVGKTGEDLLQVFLERLGKEYAEVLGRADPVADIDPDHPGGPWLDEGLRYDAALAAAGRVDDRLRGSAWSAYWALENRISLLVGIEVAPAVIKEIDSARVLDELRTEPQEPFAEDMDKKVLLDHFVAPEALKAVVNRNVQLVVGAKGAGKTVLWRYLIAGGTEEHPLPADIRFVVGHAPKVLASEAGALQLTADALKELERSAKLRTRATHKAFWLLYGIARLAQDLDLTEHVPSALRSVPQRATLAAVAKARSWQDLISALRKALELPDVGTLAEEAFSAVDRALAAHGLSATLTYDGLDVGFDVSSQGEELRERYVSALLRVIADARVAYRSVGFKVFLREDVYLGAELENKSHLEAVKVELRWQPADIWRIALNVATTSPTYLDLVRRLRPGVERPWTLPEEELVSLLEPLWGAAVEGGNAANTAAYVRRRISDASARVFPRTLVQALSAAVAEQKQLGQHHPQRVLRFVALRKGIRVASKKRVEDLITEYRELRLYLVALKGMTATGSREDFKRHMQRGQPSGKKSLAGALHAGPRGWDKVIDRLKVVGVLGEYERARTEDGDRKLAVALLYRPGLEIKGAGLE